MPKVRLGEVLKIGNGRNYSTLTKAGKYPVYGSGGLMGYTDDFLYDGESVLLPRKGTLDNIQYTTGKFWTVDTIYYSKIDDGRVDPYFLFNYLKQLDLKNLNTGTGVPSMTQKSYEDIPLTIPDLSTQKSIASILRSLDHKIEINNKINTELEALARDLYNYWFVQFEFPDDNQRPYKTAGGAMVYNEELKREIPAGWTVKSLVDIESNIVTGKTPSTADSNNFGGNIPFVTIDDIRSKLFVTATTRTITAQGAGTLPKKNIPAGSIFVSCIGTAGLIGFASVESYTNQQINSIIPEYARNRYYLYFALVSYFKFSAGAKTGNTIPNMSKSDFERIRLLVPDNATLETFNNVVEPFFNQIHSYIQEAGRLTDMRDFLLPMFMNGQIELLAN